MAKKKIFISYDFDNDSHLKNLLLAWDENRDFDFAFSDQSADTSIQSTDRTVIERAISRKINDATYFLCIVGSRTSESCWVRWEIEKAKELGKKLVGVKSSPGYRIPGELKAGYCPPLAPGVCRVDLEQDFHFVSWADEFTLEAIKKAIDVAQERGRA